MYLFIYLLRKKLAILSEKADDSDEMTRIIFSEKCRT